MSLAVRFSDMRHDEFALAQYVAYRSSGDWLRITPVVRLDLGVFSETETGLDRQGRC